MPELVGALILITVTVFAVSQYRSRKKAGSSTDSTQPQPELDPKSYELLHQATKKAQAILGMAEIEGIKTVADARVEAHKFEQQYTQQLQDFIKQTEQDISKNIAGTDGQFEKSLQKVTQDSAAAEQQFQKFLDDLKVQSQQVEQLVLDLTKQKVNVLFEHFEQNLSDFLTTTQQRSVASVELELQASRQLIETYKQQQLALVDENVVAMLEQTLSDVLAKKLSLKDQVDLVYEALEKAKADKFII